MADEEGFDSPAVAAVTALAEWTFIFIPTVVTVNFYVGEPLSTIQIVVGSALLAVPAAVEFVSSNRNLSELGRFLAVVAIGWPVSGLLSGLVIVTTTLSLAEARLALLPAVYLLGYLLVYAGWYGRIKTAVVG
jgi:hypothetical protein